MRPGKQEVSDSQLRIGIFISRTLWSWPSCMEEIIHSVYPSHHSQLTISSRTILGSSQVHQE